MHNTDNAMVAIDLPPIPARMVNEFVYCPRLAYLEWVQAEFSPNEFTVDGAIKHKRVDKPGGDLPAETVADEKIHARSVWLTSERLGLTAKIDLVEGEGHLVTPVDYKRGKRPHIEGGVYEPERVQLCVQGLLLREHGFACAEGIIWFAASKERVRVALDQELEARTIAAVAGLRALVAEGSSIPEPFVDSPKCPRCSLIGICLPDEVRFLTDPHALPRPIAPALTTALPLYVQSPRAWVRKDGEILVIEEDKKKVGAARLGETSQVVLFGSTGISTPALHECLRREIPVTFMSYGGWFIGHTVSTGHRNVETRTHQYRASFDEGRCLRLACSLVAAKIANCRTLLRRNWRDSEGEEGGAPADLLRSLQEDIGRATRAGRLDTLLGVEGAAAARYFGSFERLLKLSGGGLHFDFVGRNRRPPKDPVNAMLSFAYAMLTREWTVTLAAVGLDPYRGFYHQPRLGRPALALDMMEPFRPLIADSTVITAINNGEVRQEDFIISVAGCNLKEAGRKRFIACFERRLGQEVTHPVFKYRISYRRLFEVQARLLIRYLAGEIPRYPQFITR